MSEEAVKLRKEQYANRKLWKAQVRLRSTIHKSLSYEDSLLCLKDAVKYLEQLPVFDVAYETFVRQRDYYFRECEAHAIVAYANDGTVLKDHLVGHMVLWGYDATPNNVTAFTELFVPLGTPERRLLEALKEDGKERLYSEGVHPEQVATLEVLLP